MIKNKNNNCASNSSHKKTKGSQTRSHSILQIPIKNR